MENINFLLEKFKKIRDPKKDREKIALIISEVLDFDISEKNIEIKNSQIKIKTNPTVRSQIFSLSEKIKNKIKESLPEFSSFDLK